MCIPQRFRGKVSRERSGNPPPWKRSLPDEALSFRGTPDCCGVTTFNCRPRLQRTTELARKVTTMKHMDDKTSKKRTRLKTRRREPMDKFQGTISQKIARAAHDFEKRRTEHGRKWIAVFMNEETIVIALHGHLTPAEKALMQSPAGCRSSKVPPAAICQRIQPAASKDQEHHWHGECATRPRKLTQRPAAWCRSSRPAR